MRAISTRSHRAVLPWEQLRHLYWAGWAGLLFRDRSPACSAVFQVLPVDPERGLTSTLTLGRAVLERGDPLVWFPRRGARPMDGFTPSCPGSGCCSSDGSPRCAVPGSRAFEVLAPGSACRGRIRSASASGRRCAGRLSHGPKRAASPHRRAPAPKGGRAGPRSRRGTRQPCDLTRCRCRTHSRTIRWGGESMVDFPKPT